MNRVTRTTSPRAAASAGVRLGERLRQLRVAAGLTQTELAGTRFSKEYVSQIERGKTRPARETIEWLAEQLGVDADFLANGVTAEQRGRVEAALARGEALTSASRDAEAVAEFENARTAVLATGLAELEVRALCGESWARMRQGEVREAIELLNRARSLVEGPGFSDVDRANVGRLLNNLGALNFLLGKPDQAVSFLKDAFRVALELENDAEAAQAVSSLAQVHLRTGDPTLAEEQARHALKLLDGRVDYLDQVGSAQLVLGRALLEQGRLEDAEECFRVADAAFEQLSAVSQRAAAWVAQGDLKAQRGEHHEAAKLYRRAAEALQDVRF